MHLRGAPEAVGVLHRMDEVVVMAGLDAGALDEPGDRGGRFHLTGVRSEGMDVGPERAGAPH